jgi:hypothetical protein
MFTYALRSIGYGSQPMLIENVPIQSVIVDAGMRQSRVPPHKRSGCAELAATTVMPHYVSTARSR